MRRASYLLALIAVGAGMYSCSSNPGSGTGSTSTTPPTATSVTTVSASSTVQQQLGISTWRVYFGGPHLIVTAFDGGDKPKHGLEITAFAGTETGDGYLQLAVLDGTGASVQRYATTGFVTGTLSDDQAALVVAALYDLTQASKGSADSRCDENAFNIAAATGLSCVTGNVGLVSGALGDAADNLGIGEWYSGVDGQSGQLLSPGCETFASALSACISDSAKASSYEMHRFVPEVSGNQAIDNAEQWVQAKLQYCQSPEGQPDPDKSCSSTCNRTSNSQWNSYRSDCSGLVSWAWQLPAPGRSTAGFAPHDTSVSYVIQCTDLAPGDAANRDSGGHIVLFKDWVTKGSQATFIEEPGCSSSKPYAREFTSSVSCNGTDISISYEGSSFTAIRYKSMTGTSGSSGSSSPSSSGSPTGGTCSGNDGTAYSFFVKEGLNGNQSAGIVGNLIQESGVDPNSSQKGGPGRGIAQWSVGQRWDTSANDNVKWYAQQQGESMTSLNLQLQFVWYELQKYTYMGLSKIKAATSLSDATVAFQNSYERCGTCMQSNRIDYAQSVANSCGQGASPENTKDAPTTKQVADQANNTSNATCGGDAGTSSSVQANPNTGAVSCGSQGNDDAGVALDDASSDDASSDDASSDDASADGSLADDASSDDASSDDAAASDDAASDDASTGDSGSYYGDSGPSDSGSYYGDSGLSDSGSYYGDSGSSDSGSYYGDATTYNDSGYYSGSDSGNVNDSGYYSGGDSGTSSDSGYYQGGDSGTSSDSGYYQGADSASPPSNDSGTYYGGDSGSAVVHGRSRNRGGAR